MEYCFNLFNKLAADGTAMAVEKFLRSAPEAARGGGTKRPAEKSPEEELELPSCCVSAATWRSGTAGADRRLDAEI